MPVPFRTVVMSTPAETPSKIFLDECFAAADDRFLDEWVKFRSTAILTAFMQQWLADERPWARQQIVAYLQRDLNFAGHEVFVKRLFRHFEAKRDHAMLGRFLVAFDRIVRRRRVARYHWNPQTRETITGDHLFAAPNKTILDQTGRTVEYGMGKNKRTYPLPDIRNKTTNRLFRHRTRNYLRRRVWRYFRWLSYRQPSEYLSAITTALIAYKDSDFQAGENIIDNWSLMHACFFHSDVVTFTAAHTNLKKGQSLGSLSAAPYQAELWRGPEAVEWLISIVSQAESALARIWAMELLQRDHQEAIHQIDVRVLMRLLSHSDSRVQEFASELFRRHRRLSTLTISTWLELLEQSNYSLLPVICEAMTAHVSASRLDNAQIIELASAQPVPVAELGFRMLQLRHSQRPHTVPELISLSRAKCESLADRLAAWALKELNAESHYSADAVVEFFDSLLEPMRASAMNWLEDSESRGYEDPVLWAKLIETPFDDVRLRLIDCLHRRTTLPGTDASSLSQMWCSVILGVHRGGRAKLKAMQQIQSAILRDASQATRLLPVLAVAVRSLRAPERRGALQVIATLRQNNSELEAGIQKHLPDLEWNAVL